MKWDTQRGRILRVIKDNEGEKGIPIHKLLKKINLPRSTLMHYLKELELRELIKTDRRKEKGNPIYLKTTSKAKPFLNIQIDVLEKLLGKTKL